MASKTQPAAPKKSAAAALIAAMLVVATPFVGEWEGKRNIPYKDVVGVATVCYGETRVEMRKYTDAECEAMLQEGLKSFGLRVAQLSPGIDNSPYEWAAHTSFAYNVGVQAYANSSVRKLYNAGRRVEACRFLRNYKYAGGRVVTGLVFRREGRDTRVGEYELCLVGAVPQEAKA